MENKSKHTAFAPQDISNLKKYSDAVRYCTY